MVDYIGDLGQKWRLKGKITMGSEKRIHTRINTHLAATFIIDDNPDHFGSAIIKNLSITGMFIATPFLLGPNDTVVINFTLPSVTENLITHGKVVRLMAISGHIDPSMDDSVLYGAGLSFFDLGLNIESMITEYIQSQSV